MFIEQRYLLSASRDRFIHIFDATNDYVHLQTVSEHSSSICSIKTVPMEDGMMMVSCGNDKVSANWPVPPSLPPPFLLPPSLLSQSLLSQSILSLNPSPLRSLIPSIHLSLPLPPFPILSLCHIIWCKLAKHRSSYRIVSPQSLLFRYASPETENAFQLKQNVLSKTTPHDMIIDTRRRCVATACQDRMVRYTAPSLFPVPYLCHGSLSNDHH